MGKKNKRASNKNEFASMEAAVQKLNSLLLQPDIFGYVQSGALRGVRQKLLTINYQTIRNVVDKVPIINAIINTRVDQLLQFAGYASEKGQKGFTIVPAKSGKVDSIEKEHDDAIEQLTEFLEQTGFKTDPDREDDLSDFMGMAVRELLTIDQLATEIQRNRKGDTIAFWLVDGATIKRANPKENPELGKDTAYVQEIESKIYAVYTKEDLIFDYKNKRVDLRYRGWGYSPVEMCIDLVTTILFGYTYLRDQLLRDRIPKGFISVMGDVGQSQIDALRRYWYAAMSGAGGAWNIPILPSGKEGVGIDFKSIGQSNRDMEYHKLMMFLSSVIAAVFGIDLAELGIKADDSTAIIGENSAPRLKQSKDRGLSSMIAFMEQYLNKILRKVTLDWKIKFVGFEAEDEQAHAQLRKAQVEAYRTINEIRKEEGLEELEDDYANVVLNPQAVQIYSAAKAQESMGGGMDMGEGMPGEETPDDGMSALDEDSDLGGDEEEDNSKGGKVIDWRSAFGKSKSDSVIRIVIQ